MFEAHSKSFHMVRSFDPTKNMTVLGYRDISAEDEERGHITLDAVGHPMMDESCARDGGPSLELDKRSNYILLRPVIVLHGFQVGVERGAIDSRHVEITRRFRILRILSGDDRRASCPTRRQPIQIHFGG